MSFLRKTADWWRNCLLLGLSIMLVSMPVFAAGPEKK